jgi:uncharacterized protein YecT (DUF1311 family)
MPSPLVPLAAAAAATGALGLTALASRTQDPSSARAAAASVPPIREPFTPLPCSGAPGHRDTLQLEGCAEQLILHSDAQIDRLAQSIFTLLADSASQRDFIAAERAWLSYRKADCLSRADQFRGGTLAGVVDAQCSATRSAERVGQLHGFLSDLRSGG